MDLSFRHSLQHSLSRSGGCSAWLRIFASGTEEIVCGLAAAWAFEAQFRARTGELLGTELGPALPFKREFYLAHEGVVPVAGVTSWQLKQGRT